VVVSILQNEKYSGNAVLQKGYTTDFLTKAHKVDNGEIPKYFVEQSHPAIIEPELYEFVQYEFQRRAESGQTVISTHPLSGKVFCGDCGALYGPRVQHSTSKYRRVIWRCNHKYARGERGAKCPSASVTEEQVQAAFLAAFNRRIDDRDAIFAAYDEVLAELTDTSALDAEAAALAQEGEVIAELNRKAVEENARQALDQDDYNARRDARVARFDEIKARQAEIGAELQQRRMKRANITRFLQTLSQQENFVDEFDEELWYLTVDRVEVFEGGRLRVVFRDGGAVDVSARSTLV
jgi:hypothetical protein